MKLLSRGTTVNHTNAIVSYGRGILARDQDRTALGRPCPFVSVLFDFDVARGVNCPRLVLADNLTRETPESLPPWNPAAVVPMRSAAGIVHGNVTSIADFVRARRAVGPVEPHPQGAA